ncbi:MAG: L,D-transpeptidase family protein [Ruminococcus sp.]|nr:L,D-transpeptidase family protein [Ruminococcus sp.]MDD6447556.1 L,D-transpeptidase family protein [Ruminococcus sp.]MDY2855688.1 L,D-transpeptidase family protein [Oscillospiraceae bacterium]
MVKKGKNLSKIYSIIGIVVVLVLLCLIVFCVSGDNSGINKKITEAPTEVTTQIVTEVSTSQTGTRPSQQATQKPTATATAGTEKPTMSVEIIDNINNNNSHSQPTAPPTQPNAVPTEAPTQMPTEDAAVQLNELISESGYTAEQIYSMGINQLVVVDSFGTQADVYLFSNSDGLWKDEDIKCGGFVGKAGVAEKNAEGDKITPKGLYSIGDAFYTHSQPSTWLNAFKITENTYWVDDPKSSMYNQKVEGEQNKDWDSAEHMIDYNDYRYGFTINYNTNPIIAGKGSAIFMHCGNAPTAGCIAVSENDMLRYLDKLSASKNPHILIF